MIRTRPASVIEVALTGLLLAVVVLSCKNSPPMSPEPPAGVSIGGPNIPYQFTATATDPEADSIAIRFSWGDSDTSAWSQFVSAGDTVVMSHAWRDTGLYQVRAQAQDKRGGLSVWSTPCFLTIGEGILKWRYPGTGFVLSSPTSSPAVSPEGTIYIGEAYIPRSYLWAINPDGSHRWYCRIDDFLGESAPAVGTDGTIYIGGWNWLSAVSPSGILKWRYGICGTYTSPAIGSDNTVYIGTWHGDLYALNPDGTLKWRYYTTDNVVSSPAIGSDGTVHIGAGDWLYALNHDGTLKWRYETEGTIYSSPAIGSDGTVYIGAGDWLYALNHDGTLKWRYQAQGSIGLYSSPAISSDGTVYVGSEEGAIYALNPDGTLKWRYQTEGRIYSSPAISSDGTLYIGSEDEAIYASNPDGALKWRYQTQEGIWTSPAIGSDGSVYITSAGYLYAIQGSSVLADSPWPKFQHDNQNTGRVGGGGMERARGLNE
jgi:outer membrane protein assembly factor BamB